MWLPKEERKLLKYCYDKSKKVGETFEAPIYEIMKALGFKEKEASTQTTEAKWDMAFNVINNLKDRGIIHYEYEQEDLFGFKISLTLKGLDLGRKYSSKSHTILLWCNEYKIWVIISTIIALAGIITSILVAILKD